MNRSEFNGLVEEAIERTRNVLIRKGAEYAGDVNVFHNFDAGTGISLHNTNVAVAWEYACKHLQSIKDLIKYVEDNGTTNANVALVNEKFGDAINYLLLMEGMFKKMIAEQEVGLANVQTTTDEEKLPHSGTYEEKFNRGTPSIFTSRSTGNPTYASSKSRSY